MSLEVQQLDKQEKEFTKLVDNMHTADAKTIAELMFNHFNYEDREYWILKAKGLLKVI